MSDTDILRTEHLSLVREGRPILKDISLSVGAGTEHSILGSNAAGKFRLAATLMGCHDHALTSGSAVGDYITVGNGAFQRWNGVCIPCVTKTFEAEEQDHNKESNP